MAAGVVALWWLQWRLEELEQRVGDGICGSCKMADELLKVQVALSNVAGKRERIKILFKKIEDVIKYLDPQYTDRMAVPDVMKLQFILAEEQVIPSQAALLEQVKSLQPILESASIQGIFHISFLKSHVQTLLLSKQFVQWNEILTQLEMAKEAKPAAE
ncbi:dynactin subunit 3 [Grus japonensis]|uniref:Dynactin subunit 3 n=1 Tax=Grus japonensis TaxID=30415 RepID=A0ABC9YDJ2_GRUJA